MLPDADAIIFCNPPDTDRAQGWHRDTRWWGIDTSDGRAESGITRGAYGDKGPDFSEAGERARWA